MGAMKIYRLTGEGRRRVKVPGQSREPILDHLYEFKTSTHDELLALDGDARSKLRGFVSDRLVMEVT